MTTQLANRNELDRNVAFLDIALMPKCRANIILLKVASTYYHKVYTTPEELNKDAFNFLEETIGRLPRSTNTLVADCSISMTPKITNLIHAEFEQVLKRHPRAHTTEIIFRNIIKAL